MSKRRPVAAGIRLEQVLARYWELANLDPEITKGTITGQLKALDALYTELSGVEGVASAVPRAPGVYRASWLVEPGREN